MLWLSVHHLLQELKLRSGERYLWQNILEYYVLLLSPMGKGNSHHVKSTNRLHWKHEWIIGRGLHPQSIDSRREAAANALESTAQRKRVTIHLWQDGHTLVFLQSSVSIPRWDSFESSPLHGSPWRLGKELQLKKTSSQMRVIIQSYKSPAEESLKNLKYIPWKK